MPHEYAQDRVGERRTTTCLAAGAHVPPGPNIDGGRCRRDNRTASLATGVYPCPASLLLRLTGCVCVASSLWRLTASGYPSGSGSRLLLASDLIPATGSDGRAC